MKILLTGSHGMLASELQGLDRSDHSLLCVDKDQLDITDVQAVDRFFDLQKPDICINCAAYTNVEDAEDIGKQLNYSVNHIAVGYLAQSCKKHNAGFITISTDYVFKGQKHEGYLENDSKNPLNDYGRAKDQGENLALELNPKSIIIRTSRLYGWWKEFKNFVNTMLRLSETKTELNIINDQWGNPTYAQDLAVKIQDICKHVWKREGKILHCSNQTPDWWITRYDFAKEIFTQTRKSIVCHPIPASQYPTKAKRPTHSKLLNSYPEMSLPDWKDALKSYLITL